MGGNEGFNRSIKREGRGDDVGGFGNGRMQMNV